jgi:hypothetical protein
MTRKHPPTFPQSVAARCAICRARHDIRQGPVLLDGKHLCSDFLQLAHLLDGVVARELVGRGELAQA